jgi:TRAP-type mannitol/chloroaromatic compound transport system permease small subunit
LEGISRYLDRFSELTGKICSWFVAIMVLITCLVVIMRYGMDMGSVFLQDVVLYLHGSLFLLGAAFALKRGAHVRVDIFYRNFNKSKKALVDLLGNVIFLQPVCWTILLYSWGYVEFSWRIMEVSPEPDGLPFVYIQKSLLIAVAVLLSLQSLSEILKSYLIIKHHD